MSVTCTKTPEIRAYACVVPTSDSAWRSLAPWRLCAGHHARAAHSGRHDPEVDRDRAGAGHRIAHARTRGADIYTYFQLQVLETWKSPAKSGSDATEVAVPGGVVGRNPPERDRSAGAETGPGVRAVPVDQPFRPDPGDRAFAGTCSSFRRRARAAAVAQRPAASELMLDRSGRPVEDHAVSLPLQDLRARVRAGAGGREMKPRSTRRLPSE